MTTQLKTISEITPAQAFNIIKTMVDVQMGLMDDPMKWVNVVEKAITEKLAELGVSIFPAQGNLCFALSYMYDREMTDALLVKCVGFLDKMKVDPEFRAVIKEAVQDSEPEADSGDLELIFDVIDDQIAELKSIQYLYMTALRGMYN